MMRALLATGLLLAVVLAGCSGSSRSDLPEDVDVPVVDVTEDTGGIRGVVIDPAIRPVADANVTLIGPDGARMAGTSSAEDGTFTFDGLAAGLYILEARHPMHRGAQATAAVEAGVQPPVTRIVLQPRFSEAPFTLQFRHDGYFDCSQNGAGVYSSSNCVTDHCPIVMDPATCNGLPTKMLDNVTSQQREWHMDVQAGWQGIVFEMQWEPSAQGTSPRMGMVVSTYKPLREPSHSFANYASASPFRLQLDVNQTHETGAGVAPDKIPWEGMEDVSYFVSVRRDTGCPVTCPPGLALQQRFQVFATQFYYMPVPEGWSFLAGDELPA
jgi:hypothetical protein